MPPQMQQSRTSDKKASKANSFQNRSIYPESYRIARACDVAELSLARPLLRPLVSDSRMSKCVQCDGHKNLCRHTQFCRNVIFLRDSAPNFMNHTSCSLPASLMRTGIVAAILFVLAHFAMLIGVTTPEKFYFDEVHYVPAARQMLEPVMPQPMLNPMHPPLAKQFIALSIYSFGDGPLGWRYPAVLFGSLAIVAVYLCGLALFAAQGPAIAASLLAFFNQMLFVQSRIAMLDIFALTFSLFAIAAFIYGFRTAAAACLVRAGRDRLRSVDRLQMERAVRARGLHRHRRGDPPDARLAHAVRRRPADDWYRPDLWPDFKAWHFAACFILIPAPPISRRSFRCTDSRSRISWRRNGGSSATTPRPRSRATPI